MEAVASAAGPNTLAADTVRRAMKASLSFELPQSLPSGAADVAQSRADLAAAGLPTQLLDAAFTNENGSLRGDDAVDVRSIAMYVGMLISAAQVGKLSSLIRERKVRVYGRSGNNGASAHTTGGAGGHRKAPEYAHVAKQLKKKRAELWTWATKYNAVMASLAVSTGRWTEFRSSDPRLPPPPAVLDDLPSAMTEAQMRDPEWVPPRIGATLCERVDVGIVDAMRKQRSHMEEADTAGPAHALALVKHLAAVHSAMSNRVINGLGPMLKRDLRGGSVEEALACTPRLEAIARHLPTSVLPPQVAISPADWGSVEHICALQGWRAVLVERMRHEYTRIGTVLDTLAGVLPPNSGRTPEDYGVHPLQPGQPAAPPPQLEAEAQSASSEDSGSDEDSLSDDSSTNGD